MTEFARQTTPADNAHEARAIDRALADFLHRQYPRATAAQCRLAGLVSRQLADGHLCLPVDVPASQQAAEAYCGDTLEHLLQDNPLISADGSTPLVLEAGRLYLLRYWRLEHRLAEGVRGRLDTLLLSASALQKPLARLFAGAGEEPDWQQIACAVVGRKRFGIITGGPGTGKTTTVVKLLALLQQQAIDAGQSLTMELAAPTGKAAKRLEASIGNAIDDLPVSRDLKQALPGRVRTLHRLLGPQQGSRHFRHHHRNPVLADLVVVDEASMIDIDLMVALLDALPAHCRLVLVGDKDQLASVEAGAVMAELCATADTGVYDADTLAFVETATGMRPPASGTQGSALAQQIVTLQTNWRSQDAPGINVLAQAINRQDPAAAEQAFVDYPQQLRRQQQAPGWIQQELIGGDHGIAALLQQMQATRPDAQASDAAIDAWAQTLLDRAAGQQLLTPLRQGPDGIHGLNERISERLHLAGLIERPDQFPGQPLLVTANLYDLGLMNGDFGLLLVHPRLGQRVAFAGSDGIRWILPDQLASHSQPAHALSVHQSQGSEFGRVLLHLPGEQISEQALGVLTKELVYTAVTRAKQAFVLLEGGNRLFEQAVATKTKRYSGLAQRF